MIASKTLLISLLTSAMCVVSLPSAADANPHVGPFVEAALGGSALALDDIGVTESGDAEHSGTVGKVGAGYWFSRHWGASASLVEMGKFEQRYSNGTFRGRARSVGVSLLGRLPVTERLSVVGKVNLVRTEMKDDGSTGGGGKFSTLTGRDTSVVLPGVEVNYDISDRTTLFLDLDPRGSVNKDAAVGYVGLGVRVGF